MTYHSITVEFECCGEILFVEITGQIDGDRAYDMTAMLAGKDISELVTLPAFEQKLIADCQAQQMDYQYEMNRERMI